MRKQKHKFVEENIQMLRTLTKNGFISPKLLISYSIYNSYMSVRDTNKMNRYSVVAKETRSSITTVRRCVSDMKSYIKE